ncbi:MAG: ATP-binding cassette domain-containing protein [Propionicimonas sp.]|uniref:ATP-binding cassette domain-containing protein n=1 Tax=Propionicimonas sp. TaxID=1955623 RepID=UPI002B20FA8B|nr:ATP-binding cassette domain-containing protein [Propionicimonas sp.]MEA4944524.1 ATP-binding cassette domain-containing protein [Propionicimonas sp.]MEA5054854.1 ATP-binding cassette domain-containing protein [Propionicimonas sp.]MEA5116110.1 ATP-binding cassette domain-containing protein [Propionicimonas sp.]
MSTPLIALTDIQKSFGAVTALRGVTIDIDPGETLALLGDNAAGKSTLMKVLTGVYQPDAGTISYAGDTVVFENPSVSRAHGIEMIFQDFALADNLDVRSNIFLGREVKRNLLGGLIRILNNKEMTARTRTVLDSLDIEIDPRLKVRRLSGGQRQAVAIGRALAFEAKLVIMDEPTANLSVAKVEKLIEVTKRLKELGIAVIIITHRMDEAFAVADRIVVMRQGSVVGRFRPTEANETDIAHLISHGELPPSHAHHQPETKGARLS